MIGAPISAFRNSNMADLRSNLLAYTHAQNLSLVGFQYLEFVTLEVDLVARFRNFTRNVA